MKKIIGLFLALMMILTVTSFAATTKKVTLTDVKGTKYEEAVDNLITFQIVNGFEDNTYRPNETVTRAQLAKMLVISMGMENKVQAAQKQYLDFSDVLSSHWGYGYIKVASDNKLVNGYTDNTFKPEGNVTYAEATAMVVRALGYDEAVKASNLSWPDNYMVYADESLELFKGIPAFKANDKATRGNIALLIWNALRTGVAEIVAENSKGLVYGPGNAMITEYLNYIYMKEAEVKDVTFDKTYKTATVYLKESGKDKKAQEFEMDAEELIEIYGKKITLLYDKANQKMMSLDANTDLKTLNGEVSRISSTKIYLINKTTGYKLPEEENILLYGIEKLEQAAEVTLLLDGTTAEYMIAKGASDVALGVVVNENVKISNDYGIKVRGVDVAKGGEDFYLADEEQWPEAGDIILYYLNEDDALVVLSTIDPKEAVTVRSIDTDSIQITKKLKYDFEDDTEYTVVYASDTKLKSTKLKSIDTKADMVVVEQYGTHTYIFVFEDAYLDSIDPKIIKAMDALESAILDAEDLDEEKYSQKSYANLMKAVAEGKELDYDSDVETITKVKDNILGHIEILDSVSKKEKDIVIEKKDLRAFINDDVQEIIEEEEIYTKKSYKSFYTVYQNALDVLASTKATLDDVVDIREELEDAIDALVEE